MVSTLERKRRQPLRLKKISSMDMWIWRLFGGLHGMMNDINTFDTSPFSASVFSSASMLSNSVNYVGTVLLPRGREASQMAGLSEKLIKPVDSTGEIFSKTHEVVRESVETIFVRHFEILSHALQIVK
uniref:Uncharacterized protein n=1 Tax=Compsopogon caeruleus TaxID=31354 RepID=A0A7S1TDI3_9RHOD|mmetsp:Transcript_2212/g.3812  ORF Transcript_2212/g.3812 Transcript_2212/m.3812 type:complete len:128 (+) Transcript_2212:987-1370(+)